MPRERAGPLRRARSWRARIDAAEVGREREASELGDRTGELDARRPCADDDEAQQAFAARGVGLHLGRFERAQDTAADRRRVVDRLQPRSERLPVVVAEIRVRRARRDDEVIERQRAIAKLDDAPRRVDGSDFAEQHRRVALPAQNRADRPRDIRRRQACRRDLVEQRLEQVIVVPVDDRDVGVGARERLRGEQPAESCADDDDARALHSVTMAIEVVRNIRQRSARAPSPRAPRLADLECPFSSCKIARRVRFPSVRTRRVACVLQLPRRFAAPCAAGFLVNHGGET